MQIIFLDTLTFSSLIDLSSLKQFGELICYETTLAEQTAERIQHADVVITNKVYIGSAEMDKASHLKCICVAATGINNINLQEAKQRNIPVLNVKGYAAESVAQAVMSYILYFANRTHEYNQRVKNGEWAAHPVFAMHVIPITDLRQCTLGIIGYGAIGKQTAKLAEAFGMRVLVTRSPNAKHKDVFPHTVSLETLLQESDFVSIHAPLTDTTHNLIGLNEMQLMKKSAVLINTARGGIVNENDLHTAISQKHIAGAALDVLEQEPAIAEHPLYTLPEVLITPHIAWASGLSQQKLIEGVALNIKNWMAKLV